MSLIQRNVIPILVLLAVIGVGMTVFAVTSPFASGQESETCEPGVGISIATTNSDGETVAVVDHGDDVFYSVRLFKDADLCDFGGGTLTITLPGVTEDYPDGTVSIDLTELDADGNETDTIVTLSDSFSSGAILYTVDQDDGVQATADDDSSVELTVRAVYVDGRSQDAQGNQLPNEVDATATSIVRITPPSVAIQIYPSGDPDGDDSQSVLQGQVASFDVVIENTGGFELSNISVASLANAEAEVPEVQVADCARASSAFEPLAVGTFTAAYTCTTTTEQTFVLRAQVTASGSAVDTDGNAVSLEVTNDDTTTVIYGEVEVSIGIENQPGFDIVRYSGEDGDNEGAFTISPETPAGSDLDNVSIAVEIFEGTVTDYPNDLTASNYSSADDCVRDLGTVTAGTTADNNRYDCTGKLYEGQNTIWATIQGTIPGTNTVLMARASVEAESISPGLQIELSPQDHRIRSGTEAEITVTVTNHGDFLSGVTVVDPNPNNEIGLALQLCDTPLGQIGDMESSAVVVVKCSTGFLEEETEYEAVAVGTARDNTTEPSNVATAIVRILSPSTDVGVSLMDGGSQVIQLVVQTVVVTETNDGDSDLTDIYVDVSAAGIGPDLTSMRLDRNSPQYVRSYISDETLFAGDLEDDILNPGETWEWRVVVIGVAGDVVLLDRTATGIDVTASGYGTDALGGSVNPETDADEIETQTLGFSFN